MSKSSSQTSAIAVTNGKSLIGPGTSEVAAQTMEWVQTGLQQAALNQLREDVIKNGHEFRRYLEDFLGITNPKEALCNIQDDDNKLIGLDAIIADKIKSRIKTRIGQMLVLTATTLAIITAAFSLLPSDSAPMAVFMAGCPLSLIAIWPHKKKKSFYDNFADFFFMAVFMSPLTLGMAYVAYLTDCLKDRRYLAIRSRAQDKLEKEYLGLLKLGSTRD